MKFCLHSIDRIFSYAVSAYCYFCINILAYITKQLAAGRGLAIYVLKSAVECHHNLFIRVNSYFPMNYELPFFDKNLFE